jgi:SAM-dependent methyltransferase
VNWLIDTAMSYDTVADSYAETMRDVLVRRPAVRGVLALFAEMVCGGPVADVGCGPGHVTAHLRELGLDVLGIDLSPAMIGIARREYPGIPFEVGSMTDLDLADCSAGGVLAWYSLIHVPDGEVPAVLAHFHRVLRPGGVALLGFHIGDEDRLKTRGYGGHPMQVHVNLRPLDRVESWVRDVGFTLEARVVLSPDAEVPAGILLARRPDAAGT